MYTSIFFFLVDLTSEICEEQKGVTGSGEKLTSDEMISSTELGMFRIKFWQSVLKCTLVNYSCCIVANKEVKMVASLTEMKGAKMQEKVTPKGTIVLLLLLFLTSSHF